MSRRILIFLIAISLLFVSYGCSGSGNDDYTIKYNLSYEPTSLDPQVATDASAKAVIINLFEGLTRLDSDGNALPAIAESWSSDESSTSFMFNLRKDACWADDDNTPVTAKDFVFALERAVSPETSSSLASVLYCIKNAKDINSKSKDLDLGVTAIDDYTLEFDLEYSYADFPKLMASTVAMPCNKDYFNECQGQYGLESNKIIGNGSFSMTNIYSWSHDEYINLSKSESYSGSYPSKYAGITFTIGSTYSDELRAIDNEELDATIIDSDSLDKAKENNMKITEIEDTCLGLSFNLKDKVVKNRYIRLALLSSLNRKDIIKNTSEGYSIANDIILPTITVAGRNYRELAGDGYGISKSSDYKTLLKKGLYELDLDSLPAINIMCLESSSNSLIADNVLEALDKKFSTYFNIEPLSNEEFEEKLSTGDYQIALYPLSTSSDTPYDMLSVFGSKSDSNFTGLKSEEYNSYLKGILNNTGEDIIPYCVKAEKYLNTNAIFYPICYEKSYFVVSDRISQINYLPFNGGIDFSGSVEIEK